MADGKSRADETHRFLVASPRTAFCHPDLWSRKRVWFVLFVPASLQRTACGPWTAPRACEKKDDKSNRRSSPKAKQSDGPFSSTRERAVSTAVAAAPSFSGSPWISGFKFCRGWFALFSLRETRDRRRTSANRQGVPWDARVRAAQEEEFVLIHGVQT